MVELPFSGHPKESMDVVLEGRSLRIRSRFANLMETWTISIFDIAGDEPVPLIEGIPVLIGADLLAPYALELGGLFAEPNERPREDAKRGELGTRVRLIHYTPEELEAE